MKIVFFSSNRREVELLSKELMAAGIPCHVRDGIVLDNPHPRIPEAELWVQNDRDTNRAFMFCVERDAGFAKRDSQVLDFEDLFPESRRQTSELAA